jgi:hypothetical protein
MFFVDGILIFLLVVFAILVLIALNLFLVQFIITVIKDLKSSLDDDY